MVCKHEDVERFFAQIFVVGAAKSFLEIVEQKVFVAPEVFRVEAWVQQQAGKKGVELVQVVTMNVPDESRYLFVGLDINAGRPRVKFDDDLLILEVFTASLGQEVRSQRIETFLPFGIVDRSGPQDNAKGDQRGIGTLYFGCSYRLRSRVTRGLRMGPACGWLRKDYDQRA
jgi:hypothetical protein